MDTIETYIKKTALVYAYKTKNAEKWGIDPNEIGLAYQVDQPLFPHQCEFGKGLTTPMLREFKNEGGAIKVINTTEELIMPLSEHKVLVPVPQKLLQEWELSDLLD
jgi:hypothetical protein